MKITVRGGKALLVIGDGAVARVTNERDSQATLLAAEASTLHVGKDKENMGAVFTNGAAIDLDDAWLVEALRFLGYVIYLKPRHKKEQEARRRAPQSKPSRRT